jgi:hypothetical protein
MHFFFYFFLDLARLNELENIKAHLKLSFVRDKYIPLKREYIKSLNGRSNVQLMVAKYGV